MSNRRHNYFTKKKLQPSVRQTVSSSGLSHLLRLLLDDKRGEAATNGRHFVPPTIAVVHGGSRADQPLAVGFLYSGCRRRGAQVHGAQRAGGTLTDNAGDSLVLSLHAHGSRELFLHTTASGNTCHDGASRPAPETTR